MGTTSEESEYLKEIEVIRESIRRDCKDSLFQFIKYFWDVIIPEEPVYNWHIPYLCSELEQILHRVNKREPKEYDLVINIPPGTSKSTVCTIMYPVWCWVNMPECRFLSGSYSNSLSMEHAQKSRDIIRSDKFKWLFPDLELKSDKDMKSSYENTKQGSRDITSPGGTSTGRHAHIILVDDGQNPKKAASETERASSNEWLSSTLSTRKVNKEVTVTIIIAQRLHEMDNTGYFIDRKKNVKHICLPAELSDQVKPEEIKDCYIDGLLDPIRLSRKILTELREDLGSYGYAGQIMQVPAPDEGGIIKRDWIEVITWDQFNNLGGQSARWNFKLDTAYTSKSQNDPSGIVSHCTVGGTVYLRFGALVHKEFPALKKYIEEFALANGYTNRSLIKIEPKASGLSIIQALNAETRLNVTAFKFPKHGRISMNDDKMTRISAVSAFIESGRLKIIDGGWNKEFIEQLVTFPNASHDEYVDIVSMILAEEFLKPKKRYLGVSN